MEHYKSWAGLNSQLKGFLCDDLKNRITYFLTRYHKVHDAYGRASICLDKKELVNFSWAEMCRQDMDMGIAYDKDPFLSDDEVHAQLKPKWDAQATYHEMDFLDAALTFRSMAISNALESENYIIKILAIMDRRVGQRTLRQIAEEGTYRQYPEWVKQFYELRLTQ